MRSAFLIAALAVTVLAAPLAKEQARVVGIDERSMRVYKDGSSLSSREAEPSLRGTNNRREPEPSLRGTHNRREAEAEPSLRGTHNRREPEPSLRGTHNRREAEAETEVESDNIQPTKERRDAE